MTEASTLIPFAAAPLLAVICWTLLELALNPQARAWIRWRYQRPLISEGRKARERWLARRPELHPKRAYYGEMWSVPTETSNGTYARRTITFQEDEAQA